MYRETKELTETEVPHPCLRRWRDIIDDAEKRGRFYKREKELADDWDYCAVGSIRGEFSIHYHQGDSIADRFMGRQYGPVDQSLRNLGMTFNDRVADDDFKGCRKIIDAIEKRLAELA